MACVPKKPVTMLLGFLGAKPKHLKKYSDVVTDMSFNTSSLTSTIDCFEGSSVVSHQPPVSDFFKLSTLDDRAEELRHKVMSELRDENGVYNDRPLMTYSLSNNGTYHYAYFQAFLKENYPRDFEHFMKVQKGFIFDSSPSLPTADVFSRGFCGVLSSRVTGRSHEQIPLLTPLLKSFFAYYLSRGELMEVKDTIIQVITKELNPSVPQLYLCSRLDTLVPFECTREQALLQAELQKQYSPIDTLPLHSEKVQTGLSKTDRFGTNVFLKDFETSQHVNHLRPHYKLYTEIVNAFYEYSLRTPVQ